MNNEIPDDAVPRHSYTNSIEFGKGIVTKRYKQLKIDPRNRVLWSPAITYLLHTNDLASVSERCRREKEKSDVLYSSGSVRTPRILVHDEHSRYNIFERIDMENVRDILEDPSRDREEKLGLVRDCAYVLRAVHEEIDSHGCPGPQNFGLSYSGDIYVFDLEHDFKENEKREKQKLDLWDLEWLSVFSLARELGKGETDPVLDAIRDGYGKVAESVDTFWVRYELCHDPFGPRRKDLYRSLTGRI